MKRFALKDIAALPAGIYCYDRGVYLRVTKNGRSWLLKYTLNGKRREMGLGSALGQSITAVLAKANKAKALIVDGIDPVEAKKEKREEARVAVAPKKRIPTFAEIASEALDHIVSMRAFRGARTEAEWRRDLKRIGELFADTSVNAITRDDVAALLSPVWRTQPRRGRDFQSRMLGVFDYCILKGWIEKNPAAWKNNLDAVLPSRAVILRGKAEEHHAAVSAEDMRGIAATLWNSGDVQSMCALFGLLTVGRYNEFASAKWDEIDLRENTFVVPPERRKDGKGCNHIVPLSKQALAVIHRLDTSGEKLFERCGTLAVLNRFKAAAEGKAITTHGLRSTFSDWCARNNKNFLVSEKCLMHSVGNQVFRAYQRDDLLDQRRELLQEWADYLLPNIC